MHCKVLDGLRSRLRELRDANGANVTITFALATVPMIGFVGAAVDYSHANSVKAAMQAAADATALMLAKNAATLTSRASSDQGQRLLQGAVHPPRSDRPDGQHHLHHDRRARRSPSRPRADVKTDFMQLMGFCKLKVAVDSQARWGTTKLQVALALDITGSMASDGKMPALKTATKELLTTLQNAATTNGDVRVAIIPFAKYVTVDPATTTRLDRLGGLGRRQRP